jgi:hypothetical protein
MTSSLERRYRSALRLLPASYRARWEEDMVGTFLEGNAGDRAWPRWSELVSVAGLTLRLRLGGVGAEPASFTWGEAVRRVALLGLLVNAILGVASVVLMTVHAVVIPGVPQVGWIPTFGDVVEQSLGLFWLAAFLCVVWGRHRAGQRLAVAGLVATAYFWLQHLSWLGVLYPLLLLAFTLLQVIALCGFHDGAPRVRRWPWLTALVVIVSVYIAVNVNAMSNALDPVLVWCGLLLALGVCHAVAYIFGPWLLYPHWMIAVSMLALMTLALRVGTLSSFLSEPGLVADRDVFLLIAVVEAVVLALLAVGCAIIAARAWRRLPAIDG